MYHCNASTALLFYRCWLNPHSNFVWSFIVPVLVVFLVNVGFLIMVLVIMYKHAKKRTLIQKAK